MPGLGSDDLGRNTAARQREEKRIERLYKALEDLVWLTQLGLNILLPLVLCLAGCWWAVDRWNWPEWLFLPAILLGLAAGAQNFWVFAKERLDRTKNETSKRVGFNHHQ